jgi:nitrogen fixation NifU-like protein
MIMSVWLPISAHLYSEKDIINALDGLPESKAHCSLLGVKALHNAIENYYEKQKKEGFFK